MLASIEHVKIIRFHTRLPIVVPERITDDMVAALTARDKTTYVALHANHPRELTLRRARPAPASSMPAFRC
jgi:lysine 2,3-aminomutase